MNVRCGFISKTCWKSHKQRGIIQQAQ